MGTGDWNDGMNRVGERGDGESVWLGWFLHAALMAFIPIAEKRRETTQSREMERARRRFASLARRRSMGWRMVSARLFRQRRATRRVGERRMPHRFDRPILGDAIGRGRRASGRRRR